MAVTVNIAIFLDVTVVSWVVNNVSVEYAVSVLGVEELGNSFTLKM
jgi:hypothetical protein